MNMYHWHSQALANWQSGDIVVIANSVEEARRMVRDEVKRQSDHYSRDTLHAFERDIASEPNVETIMFIYGSS